MDPRVEFVARFLFGGDPRPDKPPSWQGASAADQRYYYTIAALAISGLTRFDEQRDEKSRTRGWLYALRTLPMRESENRVMEGVLEVQCAWAVVKNWYLGGVVDLSQPITKARQASFGATPFDGDPVADGAAGYAIIAKEQPA